MKNGSIGMVISPGTGSDVLSLNMNSFGVSTASGTGVRWLRVNLPLLSVKIVIALTPHDYDVT
jgi:hypothetical protein